MADDSQIEAIKDRLEIQDLMTRYAQVVDLRAWERLPEVFSDDATADYTPTGGIAGHYKTVMEWLDRALAPWPVNLHLVGNLALQLNGDRATSRCYFLAPMAVGVPGQQQSVTNGGYYDDELVRTAAGWRIQKRTCTTTVMTGTLPEGYAIPE